MLGKTNFHLIEMSQGLKIRNCSIHQSASIHWKDVSHRQLKAPIVRHHFLTLFWKQQGKLLPWGFQLFFSFSANVDTLWKENERGKEKNNMVPKNTKTSIQPALCGGHLWGYRGVRVLLPKHWLSLQKHRNKITDRRSWKSSGELAPDLTGSCAVVRFSSVERALLHMQCSGLHALSHCVRQSRTGCRGHAHRLPGSSGKKRKKDYQKVKLNFKKK